METRGQRGKYLGIAFEDTSHGAVESGHVSSGLGDATDYNRVLLSLSIVSSRNAPAPARYDTAYPDPCAPAKRGLVPKLT